MVLDSGTPAHISCLLPFLAHKVSVAILSGRPSSLTKFGSAEGQALLGGGICEASHKPVF